MDVRNDWTLAEVEELFDLPFIDLVFRSQAVHRRFQAPNTVQISTLLSIKTGACPEDCAYCPQSVRFDTGLDPSELMELEDVAARARAAKDSGATRFCMGAAYRSPKPKDLRKVLAMIREVKALGLGDLRHARHGDVQPRRWNSRPRASIITITIWTPRRATTRKSSAPAPIKTGSTHSQAVRERRHERLLRRHRRHGREGPGSHRAAAHPGDLAGASAERAHQPPGARTGNSARELSAARSRSTSCA